MSTVITTNDETRNVEVNLSYSDGLIRIKQGRNTIKVSVESGKALAHVLISYGEAVRREEEER